ncbi:MAG TPA: tetratricopeptide repeat protein, partial [Polyangia bacterium]|nr:tetratricopeptide repeat protein [Polyangia bacterium]
AGCAALVWAVAGGAQAAPGPASFAVEPFQNVQRIGALQHLVYGLPAVVAERFAQAAPLRFAGRPELFSKRTPAGAQWVVGGSFERRADWNVAVTVEIRRAGASNEVVGRASRTGSKETAAATVIEAAEAAFTSLPGVRFTPEQVARLHAKFTQDAYAFVLYARGVGAFHGGGGGPARAALAEQYLRHALLVEPMVPEIRRFLAMSLLATQKLAQARGMLSAALDRRGDYLLALRALAAIDRTAGAASARDQYARLVALDPDDVAARRAYGELLVDAGKMSEARQQLEAVLAAEPEDAQARRLLVTVLSSRHEGAALATELEAAVKGEPNDLDLRMDLGAAYLAVGRKPEAAAVYEDVLHRRPRHPGALKLAGDLARQRGDFKAATGYYARLRTLTPHDPRPVFLLATTYAQAGDLDRAERWFEDAGQMPGMLGDAYGNLGAICLRRGDARQALWYLSRAVKRRPERVSARYNHALALHQLGRDAEALDELHATAEIDPGDAGVRFFGGVVALSLGKVQEATDNFKSAVELDPASDDARENLALLERRETESATATP